jgi:hypothetical protein
MMVTLRVKAVWLTAVTLWAIVFALAGEVRAVEERAAQQPVGRVTFEQVIDRTQRLWSDLGTPGRSVNMVAYAMITYDRRGRARQVWDVECTDAAGDVLGSTTWDADRGRLLRFGREPSTRGWGAPGLMQRDRAERIGWDTLTFLGVVDRSHEWRSAWPSERDGFIWTMAWRAGSEKAGTQVDARTGEILRAWRSMP